MQNFVSSKYELLDAKIEKVIVLMKCKISQYIWTRRYMQNKREENVIHEKLNGKNCEKMDMLLGQISKQA